MISEASKSLLMFSMGATATRGPVETGGGGSPRSACFFPQQPGRESRRRPHRKAGPYRAVPRRMIHILSDGRARQFIHPDSGFPENYSFQWMQAAGHMSIASWISDSG